MEEMARFAPESHRNETEPFHQVGSGEEAGYSIDNSGRDELSRRKTRSGALN
jgi:hypothetical protein